MSEERTNLYASINQEMTEREIVGTAVPGLSVGYVIALDIKVNPPLESVLDLRGRTLSIPEDSVETKRFVSHYNPKHFVEAVRYRGDDTVQTRKIQVWLIENGFAAHPNFVAGFPQAAFLVPMWYTADPFNGRITLNKASGEQEAKGGDWFVKSGNIIEVYNEYEFNSWYKPAPKE